MNRSCPLFFLLLTACAQASADNTATLMMPDGSRDMYLGMGLATSTAAAGEPRTVMLRPLLQVQWSNGIFASANGVLGMHLSGTAGLEYGPLLLDNNSRHPSDSRRLAGSHEIAGTPDVGAFLNYYFDARLRAVSSIVYDRSAHGLKFSAGLQHTLPAPAPHHTVSLSANVAVASAPVMRELYEVSGDGRPGAPRSYRPGGGVMAVSAGANWNWELSSKWLVHSAVTATRLGPSAADSPVVERRNVITWSSGLAYRF